MGTAGEVADLWERKVEESPESGEGRRFRWRAKEISVLGGVGGGVGEWEVVVVVGQWQRKKGRGAEPEKGSGMLG